MLRGEFITGRGLVIPNNISIFGAQTILELALLDSDEAFWVGLCSGVYTPDMTVADMEEPTLGVNGYARIEIPRDDTGWINTGEVNGERFVESEFLIWEATGGAFSAPITRMFIALSQAGVGATGVFAISGALPDAITIDEDTDEADRKFKYRLYLR